MKRILILLCALVLAAATLIGCGASQETEKRESFDAAIHEIERGFAAFYLLGRDATPAEIASTVAQLDEAWAKLEAASQGLEGIDLAEAVEAHEALTEAVASMPADGAEGEAMDAVMPALGAFQEAVEEVHESGGFHDHEE